MDRKLVQVGDLLQCDRFADGCFRTQMVDGHLVCDRVAPIEVGHGRGPYVTRWTHHSTLPNGDAVSGARTLDHSAHDPARKTKTWIVVDAEMTGGSSPGSRDPYPDGWYVTVREFRTDGTIGGETLAFYQSGCFTYMIEDPTVVGHRDLVLAATLVGSGDTVRDALLDAAREEISATRAALALAHDENETAMERQAASVVEIRRLGDALVIARQERADAEDDTCLRLLAWLNETPRRPAGTAFTAGPMRAFAQMVEHALYASKTTGAARMREAARLACNRVATDGVNPEFIILAAFGARTCADRVAALPVSIIDAEGGGS